MNPFLSIRRVLLWVFESSKSTIVFYSILVNILTGGMYFSGSLGVRIIATSTMFSKILKTILSGCLGVTVRNLQRFAEVI
jgi:hypothetical protein